MGFVWLGCGKSTDVVQYMAIKRDVAIVFENNNGGLALARAARNGDVEKINKLVSDGADVNVVGKEGITPLWWSAFAQNYPGFVALLEAHANPNFKTKGVEASSLMYFIARFEDPRFLEAALKHGGDPNLVDPDALETPLFPAVMFHRLDNVELLIKAGADLNAQNPINGWTVPMKALGGYPRTDYHLVYRLLEAGSNPKLLTKEGSTVADLIATNRDISPGNNNPWKDKVVAFLKEKGVEAKSQ